MLKLIPKRSQPLEKSSDCQMIENKIPALEWAPHNSFFWDFQEISPNLHIARFRDTFHDLSCEITFEIKNHFVHSKGDESPYLQPILVGNFPYIDIQNLEQKVLWDEYLHSMILIKFQLKILEQLLLFCEDMHTTHLFLTFNETNQDYLEIYQRFIISAKEVLSTNGEQTEIVIPTDVNLYDDLIDFMAEIDHKFRQVLWREKCIKPIYRHYLKSEALL